MLFDQFSNHCLANVVEPLRAANDLSRKPLYDWRYVTMDGATVKSSSGLPILSEGRLSDGEGGDYLFLLPSYGYRNFATAEMSRSLRSAAKRYQWLVGLDTGSWLLAAAGLLEGKRATIHWDLLTEFEEIFPDIEVQPERYIIEDKCITCGGAMTAFDLVSELIAQRHGESLRLEVAAMFLYGDHSRPVDPFRNSTGVDIVDKAVALMRAHIEEPLSVPDVAAHLEVSQRRLETVCRQKLGAGPQHVYKRLRLLAARRYAESSTYPISEIAVRCGYINASAMTRAFVEEFGLTPRACRQIAEKV
ncbi:MAG: GlxA family transcriptional regulator [Halocynthiibacter sp.]